jgi:hypothetical protein
MAAEQGNAIAIAKVNEICAALETDAAGGDVDIAWSDFFEQTCHNLNRNRWI